MSAERKFTARFSLPNAAPPGDRSYWVVEGQFLAGAYPGSPNPEEHHQRVAQLWDAGMRTYISLMEVTETNNKRQAFAPYDGILRQLAGDSIDSLNLLRFPIRDLSIPSQQQMRAVLDAVDKSLEVRRPVYLHCFGGVGRTGTAVCCWLLRHQAANNNGVIGLLKQLRQADRLTSKRPAPETSEQIEFVENWRDE